MRQMERAMRMSLVAATCGLLLAGCGGGGNDSDKSGGRLQTITFQYPGGNTLLNGPTVLHASATSRLPVTFVSGTPNTCTVSGDQLTLVAAGECLVHASQGGGATADGVQWAPADSVSQLFNVLKHAQAPVLPVAALMLGTSETVTLSATTSAGLPATYASLSPAVCSVSGSTLTLNALGACELSVSAQATDSYAALARNMFISVGNALPFVIQTAGRVPTVVLGATDAAGNALSYTSSTPTVCGVTGRDLQFLAKGTCRVGVAGGGGGAAELAALVDPRFYASGFDANLKRTDEYGEVNVGAGVPITGWCGGSNPSFCNVTVDAFSATGGFDIIKTGNTWDGSTAGWWAYHNFVIGAPRERVEVNGNVSFNLLPFNITTEQSLFVLYGINSTMMDAGGDVWVRIRTGHRATKANGDTCYVTVSALAHTVSAAPTGYLLPFQDFAVTDSCELTTPITVMTELQTHGIRELEFSPASVNLSRPTPNADGSIPAPSDPAYKLSSDITVYAPITVQ